MHMPEDRLMHPVRNQSAQTASREKVSVGGRREEISVENKEKPGELL